MSTSATLPAWTTKIEGREVYIASGGTLESEASGLWVNGEKVDSQKNSPFTSNINRFDLQCVCGFDLEGV